MTDKKLIGLSKASTRKKQEALQRTEEAIAKLSKQQQKITIRAVAKEAGVSVSYIYKYPELAYRIQQLREQQKYALVPNDLSIKNPQQQLHQLQQEKAKLAQENRKLKAIIETQNRGTPSLAELEVENIKLQTENQQLKEELQYTQRSLQEARDFILEGERAK